jgi:hypothetical protein
VRDNQNFASWRHHLCLDAVRNEDALFPLFAA